MIKKEELEKIIKGATIYKGFECPFCGEGFDKQVIDKDYLINFLLQHFGDKKEAREQGKYLEEKRKKFEEEEKRKKEEEEEENKRVL